MNVLVDNVSATVGQADLPIEVYEQALLTGLVAVDIETSGLDWHTERLGTVQLYVPDHSACVIQIDEKALPSRLLHMLANTKILKIFHHALFDLRFLVHHLEASPSNIACTKILSKILFPARTSHSLQPLLKEFLGVAIDKSLSKSDWLTDELSSEQIMYAIRDVTFLPRLYFLLKQRAVEMRRWDLVAASFDYIPVRARLDLLGPGDVFTY